jgi:class 3 adenylate cyclase/tetratricopeptide (TPR) repeat protein
MERDDEGPESRESGRRCHVTLLFSDLCDYTALNEAVDPEHVASMLQTAKTAVRRILEQHGGTLNQFYGDGFLAVFGLPSGREDDSRRAAEAALELHESIRNLHFDFALPAGFVARLHSGIHSGLVFARSSDVREGRYEIVGDPITTAARLCSVAGPDEILASAVSLRGIAPFFETESVAPLRLKGKYEPLPAFRLLSRTGLSTRFEARVQRGLTPFVGRAAELERLSGLASEVHAGRWRVVHIVGDVGVGKTRLLEEYRRSLHATGAQVHTGTCESYGRAPLLQPFLQILAQVFELQPALGRIESARRAEQRLNEIDAALVEHLPALLHLASLGGAVGQGPLELAALQSSLPHALSQLLLALAARRPLVLLLDDWQWADDASYRVLRQLLGSLEREPRPILLVLMTRSLDADDPISSVGEQIALGPLTHADAERAIAALLPHAPELGLVDSIHARSGGNPLFLEELCQAWPFRPRDGEEPPIQPVPSLLHGLIQARVERLPAPLARIAQAAAVIGSEFEAWLLERAIDEPGLAQGLERLVADSLVHESDRPGVYRFKHGVTRDVVYDSVLIVERRRWHAAIAEAIVTRFGPAAQIEHSEPLAYHYAGAGKHTLAASSAELSGDKALASSSLDRARQHYRTALSELEKLATSAHEQARLVKVSRKWAAACVFSPAPEQIEILERALQLSLTLGDVGSVAHSHYWLGWIHYALGDQERAFFHTERALVLAEGDEHHKLRAQLLANLGQIQLVAADPEPAAKNLQSAVAIKHAQAGVTRSAATPVGFVYALGCRGLLQGYLGDFTDAEHCLQTALDRVLGAEHAIEASLLGLLGMVQLWRGRYVECLNTAQQMRRTAERVRGPYVFAMSQTLGGYARFMLRREPEALIELQEAVDWLDEREMRLLISFCFGSVAEALAADGQFEAARRYALRALQRAAQLDRLGEITAQRVLALCCARERRLDQARHHLEQAGAAALARAAPREQAMVQLAWAQCLERDGDADLARSSAARALSEFQSLGMLEHAREAARLCQAPGRKPA